MRLITGLLTIATWCVGGVAFGAASDGWLVRVTAERPTAAELGAALGVTVTRVEHVADDLYRVELRQADESVLAGQRGGATEALRTRIAAENTGLVTRVQRNYVYRIDLAVDAAARAAALALLNTEETVADNPAVQPPDAAPPRGPDPRQNQQWGITKSRSPAAWDIQRGSRDLVVAVIDTGVDYNHEDLKNAMWRNPGEIAANNVDDDGNGFVDDVVGWDFADNDAFPYDKMSAQRIDGNPGHGTHCAGVVGAVGLNALGISGVAPNISVMGLRFITDKGEGTTADAIKAIKYAVANGAKVLSNSWGSEKGDEDDSELIQAITEAQEQGVLLIFAAGNGRNGVGYDNDSDPKPAVPASFDHDAIISVAATDSSDRFGRFSNWGKRTVDLAAPGVRIMSTVPTTGKYEDRITVGGMPVADWAGTSMAAPHVSGAVALMWSQHPELSAAQIKAKLLRSVTPVAGIATKVASGGQLNVLGGVE